LRLVLAGLTFPALVAAGVVSHDELTALVRLRKGAKAKKSEPA
jgi:hypothetical protein